MERMEEEFHRRSHQLQFRSIWRVKISMYDLLHVLLFINLNLSAGVFMLRIWFAVLCPDGILFVDEFSVGKIPSTNGKKFYISSPRLNEDNLRTRDRLKKLMRGLVVGENKPKYVEIATKTFFSV